jgi:AcrR family transcriptional regulator
MAKQARSQLTHNRILSSAAAEFARHGYPHANLQEVAARIGLTKGALYGHFGSKKLLAEALVAQLDDLLRAFPTEPGPDGTAPAVAGLRSFSCSLADRIESDVRINAALRLVLDEAQATLEPPAFLTDLRQHSLDLVDRAQRADGLSPALAGGPVADLMVSMLVGAYCTAPAADRSGLAVRVRGMWDVLVPALTAPGPPERPAPPSPPALGDRAQTE